MAFLTILEQRREARARAGPRGHESLASRGNQTTRRDPRVPARGRGDVRASFARLVGYADNAHALGLRSVLRVERTYVGSES